MRRFTIASDGRHGDQVTFDRAESHHLARVLRLRPGDTVVAVDGTGREYTVRLEQVSAQTTGTILGVTTRATESPFAITLVQGLPKGDKLETIIRAATELGVARIVPVVTARAVVRLDAARGTARRARWERVAREAAKQCGRTRLPVIDPVQALAHVLDERAEVGHLRLCFWEEERAPFAEALATLPEPPRGAIAIVGPEGGLTHDEVDAARVAGWRVAGFGPRLLRTETAGPAIVAALQLTYGDLGQ
jgi:16S rRNA (uracil1498-N3)-methyltransferase